MNKQYSYHSNKEKCGSFSLIETVIALGLISAVVLELAGVQGNAVYFSGYSRRITQATWLAKQVLSQIEYEAETIASFKELKLDEKARDFKVEGMDEYQVNATITEWELPIIDLLTGGMGGDKDSEEEEDVDAEDEKESSGMEDAIASVADQVFGDEPLLKIAKVEVTWPEGATRGGIEVSLLLTNMKKAADYLAVLGPRYEQWLNSQKKPSNGKSTDPKTQTGENPPGQTGGEGGSEGGDGGGADPGDSGSEGGDGGDE